MTWLTAVRKILTLRCDEASELTSQEFDGPLPITDRLALQGHLLVCRACRIFRSQVIAIHAAMEPGRESPDRRLSDAARERIAQSLREAAAISSEE